MPHTIKQYDQILLQWKVSADLTDTTAVRVIINSATRPTEPLVVKQATVNSSDKTIVEATLTSEETSVPGKYNVEIETEWSDGQVITFPGKGYEKLTISPDLGGHVEESS